jgi:hypothetical protein
MHKPFLVTAGSPELISVVRPYTRHSAAKGGSFTHNQELAINNQSLTLFFLKKTIIPHVTVLPYCSTVGLLNQYLDLAFAKFQGALKWKMI